MVVWSVAREANKRREEEQDDDSSDDSSSSDSPSLEITTEHDEQEHTITAPPLSTVSFWVGLLLC